MRADIARLEDPRLLRGQGRFVTDVDLPNALHAHYVCAEVAHGRIVGIDLDDARGAPGVVVVVTGDDLDLGTIPGPVGDLPASTARPVLARDTVRYVGEPIVAIVADTARAAADAAELVTVDIEPLPPVVGFDAALAGDALVHPELGTNMITETSGGADDVDLAGCEVVAELVIESQRVAPCPLETRVGAAWWDDDGRLVHHTSGQGSHVSRDLLARVYGLEPERIRVITDDVGGSFGAKARLHVEDLLLGELARRTGRPVRWVPTRSEDMVGLGHSRAQRQTVRVGGDRDGTIRAIEADLVVDCGAYPGAGLLLGRNTTLILPGPYRVDAVRWTLRAVVTTTTPIAAYRGAGRPEAGALLDRAVDRFAAEVGLDPLEVRRRNLLRSDELPWTNATGFTYDSGDYHDALERLVTAVDVEAFRRDQAGARARGERRLPGLGLSVFIDRTSGAPGDELASIALRPDGTLRVVTGSTPYGQGHDTAWALLVAERTGVDPAAIEILHGDTDLIAHTQITGGSRSAQMSGAAVAEATDALIASARATAATLLEAAIDDVLLDPGAARFHVAGSPGAASVGWADVAAAQPAGDGLACETRFAHPGATVPYGAYAALVTVDLDTGDVHLDRLVTVDDAGTILSPTLALGQVHGGLAQGVAQALHEEFVYGADGTPLTANLLDYGFPSAAELPSFECTLTEHPAPGNPLGFKGIAESGTIGAVPAVQNAAVDALAHLGVTHLDLPLTPERVWRAIGGATRPDDYLGSRTEG